MTARIRSSPLLTFGQDRSSKVALLRPIVSPLCLRTQVIPSTFGVRFDTTASGDPTCPHTRENPPTPATPSAFSPISDLTESSVSIAESAGWVRKALTIAPRLRASCAIGPSSRKFVKTATRPPLVTPSQVPCSRRRRSRPPSTCSLGADHHDADCVGRCRYSCDRVANG